MVWTLEHSFIKWNDHYTYGLHLLNITLFYALFHISTIDTRSYHKATSQVLAMDMIDKLKFLGHLEKFCKGLKIAFPLWLQFATVNYRYCNKN